MPQELEAVDSTKPEARNIAQIEPSMRCQ
jgi:hypothetical protein